MRGSQLVKTAVGIDHASGDPGAFLALRAGPHHLLEGLVPRADGGGAAHSSSQTARHVDVLALDDRSWVGGPPKRRHSIIEPWEDSAAISVEKPLRGQIASNGNQSLVVRFPRIWERLAAPGHKEHGTLTGTHSETLDDSCRKSITLWSVFSLFGAVGACARGPTARKNRRMPTVERSSQAAESPLPAPRMVTIRRKSLLIAFIVSVGSVGAAYLAGWAGQHREVVAVRDDREQISSELRTKVLKSERRVLLLEARRQLALTISALDERNFGIAADHLRASGESLGRDTNKPETAALAKAIGGFRLIATENLADQREAIIVWSKALDNVIEAAK